MTNERLTPNDLTYDYHKLALAEVGNHFHKMGKDGARHAGKSIDLLLEDIGTSDPAGARTLTDPRVVSISLENYSNVYDEVREGEKVGTILKYHKKALDKFLGGTDSEAFKTASDELRPFRNQTYASIELKLAQAENTIKAYELKNASKKDFEAAKETRAKYANVMNTMNLLHKDYISKLTGRVDEAVTGDLMVEMYTPTEDSDDSE